MKKNNTKNLFETSVNIQLHFIFSTKNHSLSKSFSSYWSIHF